MHTYPSDPEVRLLASIAEAIKPDYVNNQEDDPWARSPFGWIKSRPSRQVGKIGEQLVAGWCAAKGFNVNRSSSSEADRIIENKLVEIKFSTLWETGIYKFQQIRDQNYDFVFCLGISPLDAHCWVISKETLKKTCDRGNTPTYRS